VLDACGASVQSLQVVAGGPDWLHPGRSGSIQLGPKNRLAVFGEIHPLVLDALDLKGPAVAFEVILNSIPIPRSKTATRPALSVSDLMPVSRDFAFVVDEKLEAEKILKAARSVDRSLISEATIFDLFTGETVGAGKKSVALTVTLQPRAKTLTDEEIEAVSQRIIGEVVKATGAVLRS
jgi:phenylalanyl-tRNA synthetase beta chain